MHLESCFSQRFSILYVLRKKSQKIYVAVKICLNNQSSCPNLNLIGAKYEEVSKIQWESNSVHYVLKETLCYSFLVVILIIV